MLVLGRKVGETIVIGNLIEVTVVHLRSGYCRLGITAPKEIPIQRKELTKGKKDGRDDRAS